MSEDPDAEEKRRNYLDRLNRIGKSPLHDSGGVRSELSRCCAAPIEYTSGGVRLEICSRCGNPCIAQ